MRNLIYQYFLPYPNDPNPFPKWVEIGVDSARKYAEHIGVEYMFYDKPYMNSVINVFESFRIIFDESFDQYDNILLLDVDMIVNTKENVFEEVVVEDVGMVHELGVKNRPPVPGAKFDQQFWYNYFHHPYSGVVTYARKYLSVDFEWKKPKSHRKEPFAMYNGGFQLWSKQGRLKARKKFKKHCPNEFYRVTKKGETPYLNMMFFHHNFNITEVDNSWNKLNFQWEKDGDLGRITHYNDVVKDGMLKYGK